MNLLWGVGEVESNPKWLSWDSEERSVGGMRPSLKSLLSHILAATVLTCNS